MERVFSTMLRACATGERNRIAAQLARLVQGFLPRDIATQYFQYWEEHGFHITRNHFYSPIPDTRKLPESVWEHISDLPGVEMNETGQLQLLREVFPRFAGEYTNFPFEPTENPHDFYFNNSQFSGTDALVHYCMVRHFQPQRVLEVGSGYSTRVTTKATARNGATEVICIEPYPDKVLRTLPGVSDLIVRPVQEVEFAVFETLGENDILFIDSTHVVRTGGDVSYLYLEVLPRLRPGVIVHIHDIFLPKVYPKSWMMEQHLFWNEQYLLHGFLLFNSVFQVLFANAYMGLKHQELLRDVFPKSPWWDGGSFWIQRKLEP